LMLLFLFLSVDFKKRLFHYWLNMGRLGPALS
jgi:hypothetical protein